MTDEQQDGAVQPEATATSQDQTLEKTASAIAVADEPTTAESVLTDAPEAPAAAEDTSEATVAPVTADAPAEETAPAAAVDDETVAETAVVEEASPVAETTAELEPADAAGAEPETATASVAAPVESLASDDTADAPAAAEEEEPEEAPAPRDLGPEPTTMEELLAEQDSDIKSFKHGDVVEGTVVRIDKDEILVDIGAKSEGVVSNRELYGRNAESQPQLAIGDTVLVYVLQPESQEGHAVLSLRRAGLERKWRSMQEQFETGVIIEAPVIDHNKGGLIVDCGIRGFVPISQIVDFPRRPQNDQPRDAAQEIAEKLQPFVGRKLRLKILEVNRKANRLILSEKVALYEERREKRDELFSSLQVSQKVTGTVRSIAPFGVFIDLGGIDGLVHKSELSWNKVNNPESGYKVGDEVEAEVIDINHERGRISLSIRRLQPDPWHSTVADFNVGDVIDGTVTKLVNFGAFVRVRDGLEGLIHISELSHQRVAHPGDVVHEGQTLKLKIISLDSERHRLGLSLKQAEEAPARPEPQAGSAPSVGSGGAPSSAPRGGGERRPRPERGWSAQDAVQEPEGGIDNTLAAAFAQIRDQLTASEGSDDDAGAPASEAQPDAPVAEPESAERTTAEPDAAAAEGIETGIATAEADVSEPETVEPEAAASGPEKAEPEAETAEPDVEAAVAERETAEPEPAEPETVEPEAAASEPETVEPEPETAEPDVEAAVAEPEPAEPEPEASAEPEPKSSTEPVTAEATTADEPETGTSPDEKESTPA